MPSSRLFLRIDLALALTFVAACAYARRVELRQRAPLASGPPIGEPITALSPAPVPTAITVVATAGKADVVTPPQAGKKLAGGRRPTGSPATTSKPAATAAPAASHAPGTSLMSQVETRQGCGNGLASCSVAVADVVAPVADVASAKVGASD